MNEVLLVVADHALDGAELRLMLTDSRLRHRSVLTILGRRVGATRFARVIVIAASGRRVLGHTVEVNLL